MYPAVVPSGAEVARRITESSVVKLVVALAVITSVPVLILVTPTTVVCSGPYKVKVSPGTNTALNVVPSPDTVALALAKLTLPAPVTSPPASASSTVVPPSSPMASPR